ncbi:hypothetical protein K8R43_01835, partial [archaeon]|nr:hypothetical protein [archaeon]
SFVVWGSLLTNVPVVDSTNNTNFTTGILWDSGDGGAEYNGSQDLVFVTEINANATGAYGTYDYELRLPSGLKKLVSGSDLVELYVELI